MTQIGPNLTIDDLIANLEDCFDWDDRYKYILELGRSLPPLEESDRTEENRIVGCQSNAWMTAETIPGDPPRLVGNAKLAMDELGWTPRYADLPTIIETAWRWANRDG